MKKYAIALASVASLLGGCDNYSNGSRVGTIQKFSEKGLINKSGEGTLVLEGFKGVDGTFSNIWNFSAKDSSVIEKLNIARDSNSKVSVKYNERLFRNPISTDTPYIVTDVIKVEKINF